MIVFLKVALAASGIKESFLNLPASPQDIEVDFTGGLIRRTLMGPVFRGASQLQVR